MHLSREQFLNCDIYYEELRKTHRALISKNNTLNKISDIVLSFQTSNLMNYIEQNMLQETNMLHPYEEPLNLNTEFWCSGNNYFFNCLKYGFRKGVVPYKEANRYIVDVNIPNLYSGEYYNSLPPMNDSEIDAFLKENPIGVDKNGVVVHGIHRACAMIGRLIRDEKYIPFYLGRGY